MKVVYKITYPNGKIYVGKDSTGDNLRYWGSPDRDYLEKDFPWETQQDITLRKEILFSSDNISESELLQRERLFIRELGANNPEKGYNIWPKYGA
ncbi:MAG: GIY-YIG nuclease family protein [Treponematales bacterium]